MMKSLLFLCVSAALIHVPGLCDEYLKVKVNNSNLPSEGGIYTIVAFITDPLLKIFKALEDPIPLLRINEDLTVILDVNLLPPNLTFRIVGQDFSSPDLAMSNVNTIVRNQTSGKIVNLVENVNEHTVAVIVNTNNGLKVPSAGGSGWTKQLIGEYKKVVNTDLGVTLIEIPHSSFVCVLLAIPHEGREEEVGNSLTSATIDALRKNMTFQWVDLQVPRATFYTGSYVSVDKVREDLTRTWHGYKMSVQIP